MQLKMFSIRDTKAQAYNRPFYAHTHGEAERMITSAVHDPQSGLLHQYPEDFDLFLVGTFDDQSGKIEPLPTPEHIAKAIDFKKIAPSAQPVMNP